MRLASEPLVTVVMPTWNRLPYLEEATESVIAQTYERWELIVIDDGSTDGSAERLRALEDPRIRVLTSARARQIGSLRNRGVAAGSGELIAFLDSDDVWLPQKLATQVRALRESDAGWSYSRFELMDAAGRAIPVSEEKLRVASGDIVREMLTFSLTVWTPTVVVRRDVFEAAGRFSEDPRLLLGEDYELYLRLALHAPAVAVPESLARIREHPGRITAAARVEPYEIRTLIYELFLASKPSAEQARLARRLRAKCLADGGARELSAGKLRQAARLFGRSARQGADIRDFARALARGIRDVTRRR